MIATTSVDETGFHWASVARTVIEKGVAAVWVVGVPVRPVGEPGTAVSPGTRTSSRAKAPALTTIEPLVPLFEEPVTPIVCVPAALSVTALLNVFVPWSAARKVYPVGEKAA